MAGIVALALSVAGPLLLSRDVYSYAAYGRMFALHHAKIFHDVADASDVGLDVGFMAGAQIPGFAGDRRYADLA